ncbi:unnamed protein product, partial [Ectocarpus sp. 12 AP-2014]
GCCCLLLAWVVACSEVVSGSGAHTFVSKAAGHSSSGSASAQAHSRPLYEAAASAGSATTDVEAAGNSNTKHNRAFAWARPRGNSSNKRSTGR